MASLRARLVQWALRVALARREPPDEASLLRGRNWGSGEPPERIGRRTRVERRSLSGRAVYELYPREARGRGHVLYLHGGGYVNPPTFLHWGFISRLVRETGLACTVPLYPLAPEHGCEDGIGFAAEVYRNLVEEHGADRLIVMGDSAGGGLALAMIQTTGISPSRLVLNAPWLDASASDPSQIVLEQDDWLLTRAILRSWGTWWAKGKDLQHPMVSPLFGDMASVPAILLFCGSQDMLVADARRLAAKVPDKVRYVEEPGLMHAYPLLTWLPEGRRAMREIVMFVT